MTATFGKLEHQTLTLQPGLNVIHAPNEWGKSTWCAFLLNMLYGIDTKERSKIGSLADKDRYAPWSGAAMSGRIDLNWNGKDITIERSSNARIPLGQFRAYETETGLEIPELTGTNCGQMLLGVERNVFTRAGFLRLADLPVTQDDALRRRLNNLVTTGDESGDADTLGQALKDLKNKCRSNKANGLLPEAEQQQHQLLENLRDLQELKEQTQQLQTRQAELELQLAQLENHQTALDYQASLADADKVRSARMAAEQAQQQAQQLADNAANLPSREDAQAGIVKAQSLADAMNALLAKERMMPTPPVAPAVPTCYQDMTPQEALSMAEADLAQRDTLLAKKKALKKLPIIGCILAAVALAGSVAAAIALSRTVFYIAGGAAALLITAAALALWGIKRSGIDKEIALLSDRHPGIAPAQWVSHAQSYAAAVAQHETAAAEYQTQIQSCAEEKAALEAQIQAFAGSQTLTQCRQSYEETRQAWQALEKVQQEARHAQQHADTLAAMFKQAQPPKAPDTLQYSPQMTQELLANARFEQKQLQLKLGKYMGQMESLGSAAAISSRLDAVNRRIARLELYNSAIEMAQDALYKTSLALQRRFSPRITKRTQQLFSVLTQQRYNRITMAEDMSLQAAAEGEDTLQELRRRSDGTIDQLYFALRLAVAEELTPNAPLILDDALVRFDDTRLGAAMELLKQTSQSKQVILFTCQHREQDYL